MNNIDISPIKKSGNQYRPEVDFNPETGILQISGRSILENSIAFYEPLLNWLDDYCQQPAELTVFHVKLEYFNTSTSKYLLSMIEKLEELYSGGSEVEVQWHYCDEDMEELGEDYRNLLEVPFKFKEYSLI